MGAQWHNLLLKSHDFGRPDPTQPLETMSDGNKQPSTTNKISATVQSFLDDPSQSLNQLFQEPCFKTSILWGTSLAGMLAAHRFHASQSAIKTLDASVLGFLVGSGASWVSCRTARSSEKAKLDEALEKLNELQRRTKLQNEKSEDTTNRPPRS